MAGCPFASTAVFMHGFRTKMTKKVTKMMTKKMTKKVKKR